VRALRALFAVLLFATAPAAAEERITSFISDVVILPDSALQVTETIDVHSEGGQIRHGIYRDFPTLYAGPNGSRMRVGFKFEGAELDGKAEPAKVEPISNGVRIRIGSADKEVEPGDHHYVIHYLTTRQIGRFRNYDELYWNATSNGWIFPIDTAEARIHLPSDVNFTQRASYTGPEGSTANDAQVVEEQPGEIVFRTTQPLGAYEGLTVAAAWPKGIVGDASEKTKLGWWFTDYGPPLVGALGLFLVLAFYFIAWHRVGRDPRAGTIVPLFSPPDDLSPAGMRYVVKEESDNRAFAAALVDMGVRGHIKLVEEDRGWLEGGTKTRIDRLACRAPLPEDESAALEQLVGTGGSIMMEQKNHDEFSTAKSALSGILKRDFEGKLFKRNYGWAVAGAALLIAALWLAAAAVDLATGITSYIQVAVAVGAIIATILFLAVQKQSQAGGKCLLSVAVAIFGMAALAFGFPLFAEALSTGWWFPLLLPALALPIAISAFWWISAPTVEGRQVLDHIAGFKQYLSITERDRLDRMTPPEDTPQLFEKYLPYAIALGVENRWAKRFTAVLAAAEAQGQTGFVWYSGSRSPWNDPEGFTNSVGSSLASTVSSASTAPGSSSGSGGGGSSGGGGGGGGGGGW
jgi:uncharacterized membrane protein YgcG